MTDSELAAFPRGMFEPEQLAVAKAAAGITVSVCIPARNEAATVGNVVAAVRKALMTTVSLVDEIVVVDDHSDDDTATLAAAAGARVVDARTVLADHGCGYGKGEALWKSLHESTGDVVAWIDADLMDPDPGFVVGLIGPLLTEPSIQFVKGHYDRPEYDGTGGGRVTELLARPLLSQFFPFLSQVAQPLAGEYAGRRSLLNQLPFVVGYGVDVALLIDAWRMAGDSGVAQVDLGIRHHRNRTLDELGPQAMAVAQAILDRAGIRPSGPVVLRRPGKPDLTIDVQQRPPLATLSSSTIGP